jgi:hypothetical protein
LPAQMHVGISQPENLDRIWVIRMSGSGRKGVVRADQKAGPPGPGER